MIVFVKNIEIHLLEKENIPGFKTVAESKKDEIDFTNLSDFTLYKNIPKQNILKCINYLQTTGSELNKIGFLVEDLKEMKKFLKSNTVFIKAAGGIVKNDKNEVLMIKRLGQWDLPKGKEEKGETSIISAVREVNEECGVEVKAGGKVATTWHTYMLKKGMALKKTRWYAMDLISDENMQPQIEEDIEELKWMSYEKAYKKSLKSYKSIQFVLEKWSSKMA